MTNKAYKSSEMLAQLQNIWISKVASEFAKGEELRDSFSHSLEDFYHSLMQSIETGNNSWVEITVDQWAQSRPQLESEKFSLYLPPTLARMFELTIGVIEDNLEAEQAVALIKQVTPVFLQSLEYSAVREADEYVNQVSKELEEARIRLEKLDKSKSDFIAIAAHELKTPLTLIEGYASMLKESISALEEGETPSILLQGIKNGTKRLKEIIDDMIDVSLIDNELLTLQFQPLWLKQILTAVESDMSDVVNSRNQILTFREFEGIDEMTFGDVDRLRQAIFNVVSNAVKFTPDNGKITISGRKLPGFVELIVQDTGVGIAPEDQSRIFDKFASTVDVLRHSSGKTKYMGVGPGLGLPIAKGIIEAHGGTIWVESEGFDPDNCPGSIFHILIPMRKEAPDDKSSTLFSPFSEQPEVTIETKEEG